MSYALQARITDIDCNYLATVRRHLGIEVTWPQNDARTAKVTIPFSEDSCRYIKPLKHLMWITYGPHLVFAGFILKPVWRGTSGSVEVNCHDATLKLKHHHHRYGDMAVDKGYPFDGTGLRVLIESAIPIEAQLDRGIPGNHIWWGLDLSTQQGPKPTTDPPDPGDGIWGRAQRGANVWDTITNFLQVEGAPDMNFEPIDAEHPPTVGPYIPGFMCQLHTDDKFERDKTKDVFFQFNYGSNNAEEFIHEPDGDSLRNYWVEVNPGGEKHRGDEKNKGLAQNEASFQEYGIYMGWESAKAKYTKAGLEARARRWVNAYSEPPDFFTVDPAPDKPGVPQFMEAYTVGDRIRAGGRKGFFVQELTGRVVQATLKQRDQSGGANVSLDCVPDIGYGTEEPEEPGDL